MIVCRAELLLLLELPWLRQVAGTPGWNGAVSSAASWAPPWYQGGKQGPAETVDSGRMCHKLHLGQGCSAEGSVQAVVTGAYPEWPGQLVTVPMQTGSTASSSCCAQACTRGSVKSRLVSLAVLSTCMWGGWDGGWTSRLSSQQ